MKELYTIIKNNLKDNEHIFIIRESKLNSNDNDWWRFDEFIFDQVFNNYSGKEKVVRYWHEDGLCIIIK